MSVNKSERCRYAVVSSEPGVAPAPQLVMDGNDTKSRVKELAESDLRCSSQDVYVRRVDNPADPENGKSVEYYGAERCGWYQVYRAVLKSGVIEPAGVDVFTVSPVTMHMSAEPGHSTRAPSRGEAILLIYKHGVLCQASVGKEVKAGVWTVDGCSTESPLPFGVVVVRAMDATKTAMLEVNKLGGVPLPKSGIQVIPSRDDSETVWTPYIVIDLTGEHRQHVAIYCRHPATSEYECERSMVYGAGRFPPGYFVPIARARWAPAADFL